MKRFIATITALMMLCGLAFAEMNEETASAETGTVFGEEAATETVSPETEAPEAGTETGSDGTERDETAAGPETAPQTEADAGTEKPEAEPPADETETIEGVPAGQNGETDENAGNPEQEEAPEEIPLPIEGLVKPEEKTEGEVSAEYPEKIWEIQVGSKTVFVLTAEGTPVQATIRDEEGNKVTGLVPEQAEGVWMPLQAEVTLTRGLYRIHFEGVDGNSGAFTWMISKSETAEEATNAGEADPEAAAEEKTGAAEIAQDAAAEADGDGDTEGESEPETSGSEQDIPETEPEVEEAELEIIENETELPEIESEIAEEGSEAAEDVPEITVDVTETDGTGSEDAEDSEGAEGNSSETGEEETPEDGEAEESAEGGEEGETGAHPEDGNPEETAEAEETSPVKIWITSSMMEATEIRIGMEVAMTAQVEGAEQPYTLQWQYSPDGGETIVNVEDANEAEYRYILDEDNARYLWRVAVQFAEEEQPAESDGTADF